MVRAAEPRQGVAGYNRLREPAAGHPCPLALLQLLWPADPESINRERSALDLTKDKFTIGRDRACDIAIADDTVSGHHAEISFIGGGKLLLTDCKSSNGTYRLLADGSKVPIRQELVSPLDTVRFGSVTIGMRELLESLRMKYPQFGEPQGVPTPSPPAPPEAQPKEFERCDCGRIKATGRPCPGCGA